MPAFVQVDDSLVTLGDSIAETTTLQGLTLVLPVVYVCIDCDGG